MDRLAVSLALVLAACATPQMAATAPPPTTASSPSGYDTSADACSDGSMSIPMRFRGSAGTGPDGCPSASLPPAALPPSIPEVPMPVVSLAASTFVIGPAPALKRVPVSEFPAYATSAFGLDLMRFLDSARGNGARVNPSVPVSDGEWDSRVWPGPFQHVARAVAAARPPAGRFFHLESLRVDAVYALPWNVPLPNMPGATTTGFQFIDVTVRFRDHAETPPAEGELWYTWHLRLPTSHTSVFAVADGYDGVASKTWMNAGASYVPRSLLEQEATSAVAGYLWNESYVPGGNPQFAQARPTTPFWEKRVEGLNRLNDLFDARTLVERRFEKTTVRIDAFEPLTYFGGGIATVIIKGRLVEVLGGRTITEDFAQPMKFFRFGGNGLTISGWTAVDSQEEGIWLSGGDLALDRLQTAHG